MSRTPSILLAGLALGAVVLHAQTAAQSAYPISEAPADMRPAIQRGDLVIVSVQNAALAELTRELGRGGPAGAIMSCHLDVTGAAYKVAREEGIPVGRTSDRVRNPLNAPRPWAAAIVARHAGRSASGVPGYAVDLGDRVGILRPITHRSMCSPCHGPVEKFDPRVKAELQDRYPVDRGLGFKEGELRGWFWAEVPKSRPEGKGNGEGSAGDDQDAGLREFTTRVQAYVALHRRLEGPLPTLKVSNDPEEVEGAREALGAAIRQARPRAMRGDIFTPPAVAAFRALVRAGCNGQFQALLEIVTEEADEPFAPPQVNARWPVGAPYSMMPPKLLCGLPVLPEELEYRFIGRDLVLYDSHANLIVDIVSNAIPPQT